MKTTAFHKWLLSVPETVAADHLRECLASGGEAAFDLIADIHGPKWSVEPARVREFLIETVRKLKGKVSV